MSHTAPVLAGSLSTVTAVAVGSPTLITAAKQTARKSSEATRLARRYASRPRPPRPGLRDLSGGIIGEPFGQLAQPSEPRRWNGRMGQRDPGQRRLREIEGVRVVVRRV